MRFEVKMLVVVLAMLLIAIEMPQAVNGGRNLLIKDDEVHPENFFGGIGGVGGAGAGAGIVPIPGAGAGAGAGGVGGIPGIGPVDFCSVPGLGCVRVEPTNPGGVGGGIGGVGGISPPLPFP